MREKIRRILNIGVTGIREGLFRLVLLVGLFVCLVAIVAGFVLNDPVINALPIMGLLIIILIATVATFKFHKVNFASILFAITVICGIFPIVFFTSGGINGGATVWFVLGLLYIFIMFRGIKMVIFLALAVITDIGTYVYAYYHSDYIIPLATKTDMYYDSLFAVLVVGIAVGLVMWFQIRSYEKERERTLEQKDEIEKLVKSKDAFFANMSHEIRTPINTIIGLNEMILREDISDEVAEDALKVKNASEILLALINDILDFSQIESQRMTIVPVAYHIKDVVEEIAGLLQIRIKEKNLDFYISIDSTLPSVMMGDEMRIKQILINLLTNAAKYTEKGSVTLSVQGEEIEAGTERLTISVADTGIGIKKEDLESLYDYFKRIDREKNRSIEGSGLGLAITKQMLSLMGGTIRVDSIYKKGSVFTVILDQPIVDSRPIGNVNYMKKLQAGERSHYKQSFEAPMAKVLIVDDNEMNRIVISKLLQGTKVQIDTAKSGEECLEMVKKKVYHVILLDSMMPGMDGEQTLKAIRHQDSDVIRQIPIIAVTANVSSADKQKYLEDGFDGYLAKPVEGSLLEAEVLKFLPEALIEYRMDEAEYSTTSTDAQTVFHRKKKKIQISTDCVSDLSREYIESYDLKVIYSYIETERGIFRDAIEIDSDNLSRYLSHPGSRAIAVSAPVEEYEAFYAEALVDAEEVIHISMAPSAGESYRNASLAAEGFDHVHVIDAGHISCGEGLLVLTAARLLRNGCNQVEDLCHELNTVKGHLESTFLLPGVKSYYASGHGGWLLEVLCDTFHLHPILKMSQSYPKFAGFLAGNLDKARKRFIRKSLIKKKQIDTRVVFISHAGCTIKEQKEFVDEILKYIPFEKVIVERASVSGSSNGGLGTMGFSYLTKVDGKVYDKFG
ncbi:MAG: response regulator [Lachnospiraceae bacterium]|nr:response regulator [Lachnospiraceae bacterium]